MCSNSSYASSPSTYIQNKSYKLKKKTIFIAVHNSANNKFWTFYAMVDRMWFFLLYISIICMLFYIVRNICVCFFVVGVAFMQKSLLSWFVRCFSWRQKIETCIHGIEIRRPAQIIAYSFMRNGCCVLCWCDCVLPYDPYVHESEQR